MSQVHGTPTLVTFRVNSAATISAYRLLAPAAGGNSVQLWATSTSIMFAVSQDQSYGATGTSILAAIGGCAKLAAGASVSAGAIVTGQTATGLGIADTTNGVWNTTTSVVPYAIGIALDAADTNSVFEILIQPRLVSKAAFA